MGVDLRRSQTRVTEHFLDGSEVSAPIEQVRRTGVAQSVRADASPGQRTDPAGNDVVDGARADSGSAYGD